MAAKCLRHAARRDVIALLPSNGGTPPAPPTKHGQTFPREARLVRKSEFDAVYSPGKRRSNAHFTVFLRANELPLSRFGFSIKKALGGAVVRNRMRRRLREIVRSIARRYQQDGTSSFTRSVPSRKAPFAALTAEFLRLLKSL